MAELPKTTATAARGDNRSRSQSAEQSPPPLHSPPPPPPLHSPPPPPLHSLPPEKQQQWQVTLTRWQRMQKVATSVNAEAAAAAVNVEAVAVAEATAQPIVNVNDYLLQQQLQLFWAAQLQEIMQIGDFKGHSLPIFRIKKIMKSDKEVRMISAESPILLDKACELFIQELTHRSWLKAQECQRRTLKKINFFTTEEEAPTYVPGMLGNIPNRIPYCYSPMGPPAPPMTPLASSMRPPAPSMGPPAPSMPTPPRGIMGRRAMPWVAPSMHVPPPLYPRQFGWYAAGDNPYATRGSSGQGSGDPQRW
ncbi:nuclear transcription factor Y subunit C-1-like [Solanum lycopersicum]|uniref:nuclear transcription factor Y subunit C-1-like n=1 Tax=Solanum lycopersicum TaxID=4081 RepID=UPI0037483B80